jgi:hypothetical protein
VMTRKEKVEVLLRYIKIVVAKNHSDRHSEAPHERLISDHSYISLTNEIDDVLDELSKNSPNLDQVVHRSRILKTEIIKLTKHIKQVLDIEER